MSDLKLGDAITNQNARAFLEQNLFPDLRTALHVLVEAIHDNGELKKYWSEVEKKNDEARRIARRLEKERLRLEKGSDYETTGSTEENLEGEDEEESEDEEPEPSEGEYIESEGEDESVEKREESALKDDPVVEKIEPFNPVKFLAEALKQVLAEKATAK